ncbi:MAG: hypothetical protein IJ088_03225, partial [Clostridia bacterium]|nr:hypothetical protein [Clostridia bacterium]
PVLCTGMSKNVSCQAYGAERQSGIKGQDPVLCTGLSENVPCQAYGAEGERLKKPVVPALHSG